jgi:hypothetical protein
LAALTREQFGPLDILIKSALPGRFATDVAANHAVPGRTFYY